MKAASVVVFCACLAVAAGTAAADPCRGVDQSLPAAMRLQLETSLKQTLKASHLTVTGIMHHRGWTLVHVVPDNSDPGTLFYKGDPTKSPYIVSWGGWAQPDEEASIRDWTHQNAPGIPDLLASCFAWSVSHAG